MIQRLTVYITILIFSILFWVIVIYGGVRCWNALDSMSTTTISDKAQGVK